MLHRLVYLSSLTGSPDRLDLDGLFRAARTKNSAEDITGLLLYHDGNFFQVLEGPRENVLACYDRIQADRRHTGCVTLLSEEIGSRMFSEWQMAYVPYTDLSPAHQRVFSTCCNSWTRMSGRLSVRTPKPTCSSNSFWAAFGISPPSDRGAAGFDGIYPRTGDPARLPPRIPL